MSSRHAFRTYSISRRLTVSLALVVALIAFGVAAAFYVRSDAQDERESNKHADEMIEYIAGALVIPIWDMNTDGIIATTNAIAMNALVKGIIITDRSGGIIYSYQNDRQAAWIERSRQIRYKNEYLCDIRLMLTNEPRQQAQYALFRVLLATVAMILLALSFANGLLVRIFLRQPLQRLNAIVNAYAAERYDEAWDTSLPYLEFQSFGQVLQRMGTTIREQMRRLQESEDRYCKAQAMGHVGNWEYTLQTAHFWGSDEAKRIYGFDPAQFDFSVDSVEECIPERTRVHQALIDLIEAEKPYHLEFEIHPRDSSEPRIIASIAELLRDEQGNPSKVVGVIQDITTRKRAENALRESEERFRFVLNNSLDAVYRRNLRTDRYDYFSPVIERLLGWSVEEMNNMSTETVLRLVHPDDVPDIAQELERTNAQCQAVGRAEGHLEYRIRSKQGVYRWVGDTITVLADAEGVPLYRLGMIHDLTERKLAEERIREHNRLLEEAVQQKQREMEALFERLLRQERLATIGKITGSIAHELRNPLGAVKQAVYYLKQLAQRQELTAANPKALRHLQIMESELNTSERVIADLLDMTRMKPPQRQPTDTRTLIADTVERCHLSPQIRLAITLEPETFVLSVDPLQLRQVLSNVLTNAAQAIEGDGAISISARHIRERQETLIEIHDTGIGMTPDVLQNAFEPLYTTKATGTGLGLPICKEIVENHQGRISLTSQPGQGATVTIALPDDAEKESVRVS